ncbi:MAG: transposase [Paracoccaceae bacterium]
MSVGLSNLASEALRDSRTGKNTLHRLDGLFRQSVFGRLAGYRVNDADPLDPDASGRWRQAVEASCFGIARDGSRRDAGSGREPGGVDLNGQWIDRFHDRNGLKYIVLDMDSSVSPTHGDQEGANGISTHPTPHLLVQPVWHAGALRPA